MLNKPLSPTHNGFRDKQMKITDQFPQHSKYHSVLHVRSLTNKGMHIRSSYIMQLCWSMRSLEIFFRLKTCISDVMKRRLVN